MVEKNELNFSFKLSERNKEEGKEKLLDKLLEEKEKEKETLNTNQSKKPALVIDNRKNPNFNKRLSENLHSTPNKEIEESEIAPFESPKFCLKKEDLENQEKKHFSNNMIYNKKEEIPHAEKSPLHYLKLIRENKDPIGVLASGGLKPYTIEEVKKHNKKDDLWMVISGGVYNLTIYLDYHPGGVKKLMCGAGRDATELFMDNHPWVNLHNLVGKLQIGYLVEKKESDENE